MHRMPGELRVAGFQDVQLVALAAHDGERASEFVTRTLGDLATADPALRDTLRTYIREESSASRAARALFTHRNTVLNRPNRATELLPARSPAAAWRLASRSRSSTGSGRGRAARPRAVDVGAATWTHVDRAGQPRPKSTLRPETGAVATRTRRRVDGDETSRPALKEK
jgi:PucR-like helix-turn-helix protein